jgi:hypothetical protein
MKYFLRTTGALVFLCFPCSADFTYWNDEVAKKDAKDIISNEYYLVIDGSDEQKVKTFAEQLCQINNLKLAGYTTKTKTKGTSLAGRLTPYVFAVSSTILSFLVYSDYSRYLDATDDEKDDYAVIGILRTMVTGLCAFNYYISSKYVSSKHAEFEVFTELYCK